MAKTDRMNVAERRKYLHRMRILYWRVTCKEERSCLWDEMQVETGLHRKSLLRLIKGDLVCKPRRKQRGKTYGSEVDSVIRQVARSVDYPCAERLKSNIGVDGQALGSAWRAETEQRGGGAIGGSVSAVYDDDCRPVSALSNILEAGDFVCCIIRTMTEQDTYWIRQFSYKEDK